MSFRLVAGLTAGQVTFVSGCSTLKQYLFGVACSTMMIGMSEGMPLKFWVSPSTIVCNLFRACVCAHGEIGDLRQQMFDTETVALWRGMLHDYDWHVRQEALNVLGLAISHSMQTILCSCLSL